jgi:hypothetical protein
MFLEFMLQKKVFDEDDNDKNNYSGSDWIRWKRKKSLILISTKKRSVA